MQIQKAYKTELKPNFGQTKILFGHAGATRYAWNWALGRVKDGVSKSNAMALHREWNEWKKEDDNCPWWSEYSKCAFQESFRDLQSAFSHFFRRCRNGEKAKGYPRFKSRFNDKCSFRLYGVISVEYDRVKLPRIGWVRLKEKAYIPTDAHILSVTVFCQVDRWYVSVLVREEIELPVGYEPRVMGVDLGVGKYLAICSDGQRFKNSRSYRKKEKQIKKIQRRLSRQQKGSKRRAKTKKKLAKLHGTVSSIRTDLIHKATSRLAKTKHNSILVVEDLVVKQMVGSNRVTGKSRKCGLAKSIHDAAMREFRRQLEYKCLWNDKELIVADRYFPSTKRCSSCGNVKKMELSERMYRCEECDLEMDRDDNAALNLEQYYWLGLNWLFSNKIVTLSSRESARGASSIEFAKKREVKLQSA